MRFLESEITNINKNIEHQVLKNKEISVNELYIKYNIVSDSKQKLSLLANKIIADMNILSFINCDPKFIKLKTIDLDQYGRLKESVSLPVFEYIKLAQEEWDKSELRQFFFENIFVFIVFKKEKDDKFLYKIKIWQMPLMILDDEVKNIWECTKKSLLTGNVVKYIDDKGRRFSYFPTASNYPYIHVRPHAVNRNDTLPLPVADKVTGLTEYPKHSFWISRGYVLKIIEKD